MLLFHFDNRSTLVVDDIDINDVISAMEIAKKAETPYLLLGTGIINKEKITHVEVIEFIGG